MIAARLYHLKLSFQFVSSKSSNALFLVNMTSTFSRIQVLMYSKNLMDNLCIAVLFSQQMPG